MGTCARPPTDARAPRMSGLSLARGGECGNPLSGPGGGDARGEVSAPSGRRRRESVRAGPGDGVRRGDRVLHRPLVRAARSPPDDDRDLPGREHEQRAGPVLRAAGGRTGGRGDAVGDRARRTPRGGAGVVAGGVRRWAAALLGQRRVRAAAGGAEPHLGGRAAARPGPLGMGAQAAALDGHGARDPLHHAGGPGRLGGDREGRSPGTRSGRPASRRCSSPSS